MTLTPVCPVYSPIKAGAQEQSHSPLIGVMLDCMAASTAELVGRGNRMEIKSETTLL